MNFFFVFFFVFVFVFVCFCFQGGEPEFTSFTHAASATTDFIFYTAPKLNVVATLAMPARADIERDTALPSHANCSDHLMHLAVFECAKTN